MGYCCVVSGCKSFKKPGVSFFNFPKDEKRCLQWLQNMKSPANFKPTKHSRLCSLHFTEESFDNSKLKVELLRQASGNRKAGKKLKPNAVPTLFWNSDDDGAQSRRITVVREMHSEVLASDITTDTGNGRHVAIHCRPAVSTVGTQTDPPQSKFPKVRLSINRGKVAISAFLGRNIASNSGPCPLLKISRQRLKDFKTTEDGSICGYLETQEEVDSFIGQLKIIGHEYFTRSSVTFNKDKTATDYKFLFSNLGGSNVPLGFDGSPFVMMKTIRMCCTRGPKYRKIAPEVTEDEAKRKKMVRRGGCPATLFVKVVKVYLDYKVQSVDAFHTKNELLKRLKEDLNSEQPPEGTLRFCLQVASAQNHTHVFVYKHEENPDEGSPTVVAATAEK